MTIEEIKLLSDEEIRVKVAELDGWVPHEFPTCSGWVKGDNAVVKNPFDVGPAAMAGNWPDYPHDLNTVHEVEKILNREQRDKYYDDLFQLLPCDENHGPAWDGEPGEDIMLPSSFTVLHATARQRCEALIMTLGAR